MTIKISKKKFEKNLETISIMFLSVLQIIFPILLIIGIIQITQGNSFGIFGIVVGGAMTLVINGLADYSIFREINNKLKLIKWVDKE